MFQFAALGAVASALLGLYLFGRRVRDERGASGADVTSVLHEEVQAATGVRVLNRELAERDGVRPELLWLLDEWEREGTHVVRVFEGDKALPSGSVRYSDAAQAAAAAANLSRAKDVNSTPHGYKWRAALDLHPKGFNPWRSFAEQPGMFEKAKAFALWAEGKVHPNGTRFLSGKNFNIGPAPDGVMGDWVHVEILGWRQLPPLA